jgi:uncharacterized membrane protein
MGKIESAVTIERPVEEVYRYFLDLDKNAPTDPSVESVAKEPAGPTAPGTTFRYRHRTRRGVRETTMRFTALEPNERIDFEAEVGPMRPRGTLMFEETVGRTRLTFQGEPNPVGPFKVLSPLFRRKGQQIWDERLARVKTAIEASP